MHPGYPTGIRGLPPARLSRPMGTESVFESILDDFRGPPETPLAPRGDQFSVSTRPGRSKKSEKDTQSSDRAENSDPDGIPEGIAVIPDFHFSRKML